MAPGFFTLSKNNCFSTFQLPLALVPLYIPSSIRTHHLLHLQRCHFCRLFPPLTSRLPVLDCPASTIRYNLSICTSISFPSPVFSISCSFHDILSFGSIPRCKLGVSSNTHLLCFCLAQHPDPDSAFSGCFGGAHIQFRV